MERALPQLLLDWLTARYPNAKRQTLKRMLASGRVTVNGRRALRLKQQLRPEDQVQVSEHVPTPKASTPTPVRELPLPIIYEDADILVVNKPAGLLTSTVAHEKRPTLWAMLNRHVAQQDPAARVGLIHRLDRDASGLLVFSKNDAAYESLKRQFFRHTARRTYMAVVDGVPTPRQDRIESLLVEYADGSVHSTRRADKGQRAITEYQVLKDDGRRALLRVTLHTGRKHQIRAHLAERGTPIVGDRMYNPRKPAPGQRLMLVAVELGFEHPRTGRRMEHRIPLPPQFSLSGA